MPTEPRTPAGDPPRRGRPPKPPGEAGASVGYWLPTETQDWLRSQPEGPSKALRLAIELLRKASA